MTLFGLWENEVYVIFICNFNVQEMIDRQTSRQTDTKECALWHLRDIIYKGCIFYSEGVEEDESDTHEKKF